MGTDRSQAPIRRPARSRRPLCLQRERERESEWEKESTAIRRRRERKSHRRPRVSFCLTLKIFQEGDATLPSFVLKKSAFSSIKRDKEMPENDEEEGRKKHTRVSTTGTGGSRREGQRDRRGKKRANGKEEMLPEDSTEVKVWLNLHNSRRVFLGV